jgi:hypothetical protein
VHQKEKSVFSIAGIRHDSACFPTNYFSYTVKKVSHFAIPSRDITFQLALAGNNLII